VPSGLNVSILWAAYNPNQGLERHRVSVAARPTVGPTLTRTGTWSDPIRSCEASRSTAALPDLTTSVIPFDPRAIAVCAQLSDPSARRKPILGGVRDRVGG
jgi:hypothetical protein